MLNKRCGQQFQSVCWHAYVTSLIHSAFPRLLLQNLLKRRRKDKVQLKPCCSNEKCILRRGVKLCCNANGRTVHDDNGRIIINVNSNASPWQICICDGTWRTYAHVDLFSEKIKILISFIQLCWEKLCSFNIQNFFSGYIGVLYIKPKRVYLIWEGKYKEHHDSCYYYFHYRDHGSRVHQKRVCHQHCTA